MKARSREELDLYIEEHPCSRCGTVVRPWELEFAATPSGDDAHYIFSGTCKKCGAALRFEFDGPNIWPERQDLAYGDTEPSTLFTRAEWEQMAAVRERETPVDPAALVPNDYFKHYRRIRQARAMLAEALKLGADRHAMNPRLAKLQRLQDAYDAKSAEMNARKRSETPAQQPRGTFTRESLKAHADWVARGKQGDGRLVLDGTGVGGLSLGNVKLQGARLTRVSFDGARVDFAKFEAAELVECTAEKTNFAHTNFDNVVFERCKFIGAGMVLTDCNDATFTGGDFRRINADRGMWVRATLRGVDFREARIGDCVLDACVFEDCDFRDADLSRVTAGLKRLCSTLNATFRRCDLRGANFAGRRLDGTRFIDCKFAGVRGKPVIEGTYIVERPDFSAAGDGSDLRTDAAVIAIWGAPPR